MNNTLFAKLQGFRSALNCAHLERESIIDGLLASLVSRQNAFLLGAPGTGKSDLVRSICKGISGANYFGYLLSPTTDPSELYGPVAVTKLLKDEYTRDVDGYVPSAHMVFLDELFRGSSAILNSLLPLLNERTFNNGKDLITTPIQSIVAATNSWPTEESLQAFGDRFLFRPTVNTLVKPISKNILDGWALGITKRPDVGVHLSLGDLMELQAEAEKVKVHGNFQEKFHSVWEHLASRGIVISDRRRVQILKFLRAWAVVQGDDTLYSEHMSGSLIHIAYTTADDQKAIEEVLELEVPSATRIFGDAKRAAEGIMAQYNTKANKAKSQNLDSLNEHSFNVKRYYKDMGVVLEKVNQILDQSGSSTMRLSLSQRTQGDKLTEQIQSYLERLADDVNRLSST